MATNKSSIISPGEKWDKYLNIFNKYGLNDIYFNYRYLNLYISNDSQALIESFVFQSDGEIFFLPYIRKPIKGSSNLWDFETVYGYSGPISKIRNEEADKYFNTRPYNSKIGAWASKQSSVLKDREQLKKSIEKYQQKYSDKEDVPRPDHWSGWNLSPTNIEFWLEEENRIHERLLYTKNQDETWSQSLLSP